MRELRELNGLILSPENDLENLGRTYRRRADVNINLYLTEYVLDKREGDYCKRAFEDYQRAIELLTQADSNIHLSETILAYGNAIKEQFLPLHRKREKFADYGERAKKEYQKGIDLTLNIDYLRYYFFTALEQMNLEIRNKIWTSEDRCPKRVVIFHSLQSPLSHQYLKGVYYFAYKHLIEIWEYNYGRVPESDQNQHFILDRLLDAGGVIFLCSTDYTPSKRMVRFEIQQTEYLRNTNDPIQVFALDIGNKEVVNRVKPFSVVANETQFENRLQEFLKDKDLRDIYYCRECRCKSDP